MRWIGLVLVLALVPAGVCEGKAKLEPEQRVNRLWKKVGSQYGGGPVPDVRFGKIPKIVVGEGEVVDTSNTAAITHIPSGGEPTIYAGRGLSKMLSSRDPYKRRQSRRLMLREFGRTISPPSETLGVEWLKHKTNKVSHQLNKQQARNRKIAQRRSRIKSRA